MPRHKDTNWNLPDGTPTKGNATEHQWESIHAALLMDIRDELKKLNELLYCPNFRRIPSELSEIRLNTKRRRKRKP